MDERDTHELIGSQAAVPPTERRNKTIIYHCEAKGEEGKGKKQRKPNGSFSNSDEKRIKFTQNDADSAHHEDTPTGYVHLRARRGQATDSHSLAERARREKIREKLQILQSLVPGCDKITGKAHILDEIIKYVKLLQNQIECLAAKLASVNSVLIDLEVDPVMNTEAPDQWQWCSEPPFPSVLEYASFTQFRSSADITTTPTSASLVLKEDHKSMLVFQDNGELFSGQDYYQSQNIEIQCLDNLCNF